MGWDDVVDPKQFKATKAQIRYAEILLEAVYGDIIEPIYKMNKYEISDVITEAKDMALTLGIELDYKIRW